MVCPICATDNWKTARFCQECGHYLLKQCPTCRHEIPGNAKFCINCGQAQDGQDVEPPPAVRAAAPGPTPGVTQPAPEPAASLRHYISAEMASKLATARTNQTMVGERRVVTMLFCDVKGSTAAAEQLDPEEWTEIMNGAFEHMIPPVYKYEGTVARLMGDAILAFFGAPIAHEDDPQRAILAALDIVDGIKGYKAAMQQRWGIDIDVRVGINTGLVVVGSVGSDLKMEYTALGDAINLAARMEQTAAAGTIQVAEDTYKLIAPLFETEPLGGIEVKGKEQSVPAYRVLRRKAAAGRLRGIEGLEAPLIGRQAEWQQLEEALASLRRGIGQIFIINGEAGLGKSRLISELRALVQAGKMPIEWFETASFSYETSQPYGLFQRLARRVVGATTNDSPETLRDKLDTAVAETVVDLTPEQQERISQVFGSLFGLPRKDGSPPLEGESFKGLLYAVMEDLWRHRAQANPLVIASDDLHWADPASIALLQHLFALTDRSPILFLCAARPERGSPVWDLQRYAIDEYAHRTTRIEVKPLSRQESGALVDSLLANSDLPAILRERILERAEGNPFFVEEVVRTLIETGSLVRDADGDGWKAAVKDERIEIPDNLQTLFSARMDRLDEETRRVLQLAALIGRHFYYRVLERVTEAPNGNGSHDQLEHSLGELQQMDLIRETARIPELEYMFRQPLTQEAAYNTILLKQRRAYHHAVANAIVELYADRLDELAPVLAYHFEGAGATAQAIHYNSLAGDTAMRLFATVEASDHYTKALALARGDKSIDTGTRVHLYTSLGRAMELGGRYENALALYDEMEAVADELDDPQLRLEAWLAQMIVHGAPTDFSDREVARELADRALPVARQLGDQRAEVRILWSRMNGYRFIDSEAAVEAGEAGMQLARELGAKELLAYTLNDLSYVHLGRQDLDSGRVVLHEAIELWRDLNNLPMLSDSLVSLANMEMLQSRFDEATAGWDEAYAISETIDNRWGMGYSRWQLGYLQWQQGHIGNALATMRQAVDDADVAGFSVASVSVRSDLVVLLLSLGDVSAAQAIVAKLVEQGEAAAPIFGFVWRNALIDFFRHTGQIDRTEAMIQALGPPPAPMRVLALRFDQPQVWLKLEQKDYDSALQLVASYERMIEESGATYATADFLHYRAQALAGLGRESEALAMLEKASEAAEANDLRWRLWQVLADQSELVADEAAAAALRARARDVLGYVIDHIDDAALRDRFRKRADVAALLE